MYIEEQMRLFFDNTVISWHEHVWESSPGVLNKEGCDKLVEGAKKLDFDKIVCSTPITDELKNCGIESENIRKIFPQI